MGKRAKIAGILLLSCGFFGGYSAGRYSINNYANENQIFLEEKVDYDLDYYGGDTRYVDKKFNIFSMNKSIYSHFNPDKINGEIVVGFANDISDEYVAEMTNTLNYYNSLFDVINPNYHFVTTRASNFNDCNILVESKVLKRDSDSVVAAMVEQNFNLINNFQIKTANVYINKTYDFDKLTLRFAFAHEMMHILYASTDVNCLESPTTSVYNSCDLDLILKDFRNPDSSLKTDHLDMDSFVNIFPVDVATLISLYGDSSKQENVEKYLNLLNENLELCKSVYGENQFYFEDYFTLPESSDSYTYSKPVKNKSSQTYKKDTEEECDLSMQ